MIALFNNLERVRSAYLNNVADTDMIEEAFKTTRCRHHHKLQEFVDAVVDARKYDPWKPYSNTVAKWSHSSRPNRMSTPDLWLKWLRRRRSDTWQSRHSDGSRAKAAWGGADECHRVRRGQFMRSNSLLIVARLALLSCAIPAYSADARNKILIFEFATRGPSGNAVDAVWTVPDGADTEKAASLILASCILIDEEGSGVTAFDPDSDGIPDAIVPRSCGDNIAAACQNAPKEEGDEDAFEERISVQVSCDADLDPEHVADTRIDVVCKAATGMKDVWRGRGGGLTEAQMQSLRAMTKKWTTASPIRWISSIGDGIESYLLFTLGEQQVPRLTIVEEARETQVWADLGTLLKILAAGPPRRLWGGPPPVEQAKYGCLRVGHTLTETRAHVSVAAAQARPTKDDAKATKKLDAKLITGPREHWFLSADLGLNSISQLKVDETTNQVTPKDKPQKFLIGINYKLGDIYEPNRRWHDGLIVKLLVEASGDPRNSMTMALGYRFRGVNVGGFELNAFSPFVGGMRVAEDRRRPDGSVDVGGDTRLKFVAGISFNLDKALEWSKGESEKK